MINDVIDHTFTESDKVALEKERCYFDLDSSKRAVRFIEAFCRISTTGKAITLLDWQAKRVVMQLFGWKKPDGTLRFRRATISMAKKNGKSVLMAAILAYGLFSGVFYNPFCVSASTSRENAGQIYRELAYIVRNNPELKQHCKCLDSTKEIRFKNKKTGSTARYKSFSADAGSSEGENISLCVVDETHAHVSDKLYRALEYSTIARPDGLFINISTAGSDYGHFWYDVFNYALKVQNGQVVDTSLLPYICTIEEAADIDDPKVWQQANPSLNVSFSQEDFRRDLERAKQGGLADLISFRRYRLNQWHRADDSYVDGIKWDDCKGTISDEDLKNAPLVIGCDLSQTTDPCSITLCFALPDKKFYVKSKAWVCEEGVRKREKSNMPKYQLYEAEGSYKITQGTVNDYRAIINFILECKRIYNLKEVVFDQYNAMEMCLELQNNGIMVYRQPQNHKHYTDPMKQFSIAIDEKRIVHNGSNALRWSLTNTKLDVDPQGNCKPSREKSTDKIDMAVATLMAFGRCYEMSALGTYRKSVYETRGVIIL